MSKIIEMVMPKMGESIMEAKLLVWHKQVGQRIEKDETIAEVATDKVDTELPSLVSGIIKKIIVQEGEMAQVGKPMCIIEVDGDDVLEVGHVFLSESEEEFVLNDVKKLT
jgi:2-oxoglutarate dehydrogenase E2 component (dihydrolipoamide succinyltransferase)